MKQIETLVEDIYALMGSGHVPSEESVQELGKAIARHVVRALAKPEDNKKLRASQIGAPSCKTWFNINNDNKEDLRPETRIKFLFGHIHEELTLWLAVQAGHTVTHRQDTVSLLGVEGHPDCLIDGCLTDVKSANSRGMDKFRKNALEHDDPFGYLDQLNFYFTAMYEDPDLINKDQIYFLVCDKELGHVVLDSYRPRPVAKTLDAVDSKKAVADSPTFPGRDFMPKADGKSGNMMLDTECKYCEHKYECWPGLRKFIYSNGPRWLTKVAKEPDVPEDTSHRDGA